MKKFLLLGVVTCVLLVTVPVVFAAPRYPMIDLTGFNSTFDNTNELIAYSGGGSGGCNPSGTAYLKYDMSDASGTIGNATLTLKLTSAPLTGSTTVTLYGITSDVWNEADARTNNPPVGKPLGEVSYATQPSAGDKLVFTSTSNPGGDSRLVDFLNSEPANDTQERVSLAVRVSSCTTGSYEYRFVSANAALADSPALHLSGPNAVTVGEITAARLSLPFSAGLGVVALFVVAGVVHFRRRTG